MWSVFPMRPKARVLALISVIPKLLYAVYQQRISKCSQLTSSCQVRQHGLPFPAPIMVKIKPTGPLSSSCAGQDADQGQHSCFLPHLSVPPLLQYRCIVHSHLCGTQNTWHPRANIVKEDPKSVLLSSYLGPAPLATTADTATMAPPFILSYS